MTDAQHASIMMSIAIVLSVVTDGISSVLFVVIAVAWLYLYLRSLFTEAQG